MNYHEQLQMFLTTPSFFRHTVLGIGGFADYVSQFLTQFFVNHWVGACIVAVIVSAVQVLSFGLIKKINDSYWGIALSFVPMVASYCVIGVAESQLTSLIALLLGLISAYCVIHVQSDRLRYIVLSVVCLFVYLLAGTVALMTALFGAVSIDYSVKRISFGRSILFLFAIVLEWLGLVCLSHIWGDHGIWVYVQGVNYLRTPMQMSLVLYVNVLLLVISILLANIKPQSNKKEKLYVLVLTIVILVLGTKAASFCYRQDLEEMLRYDYLCRQNDWDKIIALANEKSPEGVSEHNYLNLALAKKGMLTNRAFEYYPQGPESLYVPFERHPSMSISAAEVFYHLGLTHIARRYYSESQGAIPNHYSSVRYTKRLAEIDLINGDSKSAAKYLRVMQNTLFYKEWATQLLDQVVHHKDIGMETEYGEIQSRLVKANFLSSDDYVLMLEESVKQQPENRYVWDYLLMHYLYDKRMDLFIKSFMEYVKHFPGEVPHVYQEATLISWVMSHKSLNGYPYSASQYNIDRLKTFVSTYNSSANAETLLESSYSKTLWYYLFFY